MVIKHLHIYSFKSIQELQVPFDPKITVLIGPNESGKTNILKSLEFIKPDKKLTTDLTCQFSPYYQESKPPRIGVEFAQVNKKEQTKLSKIHESLRSCDSFTLWREGPNSADYKIHFQEKIIPIDNLRTLFDIIPSIHYFDTIPIIKDRIDMDSLVKPNNDSKTELNLLKIGGIQDPSLIFEDSTKGRRATEETSKEITKRIQQVWSQEPTLEIKLRVNGKLMYVDFSDSTTVYDTPKTRSPGFLWYLSFYINFIAATNEAEANEFIFLLDEPGGHLHPSGQKDLTHLLEDLSNRNQLIYTTHSPFMINRESPERVRVVTKDMSGTHLDPEAYRDNWKPLRQSIGLTIGDLFFFNSSGILFEIPSKKAIFKNKTSRQK